MCGIIINIGKDNENLTKEMLNRIKHRGPDDTHIVRPYSYIMIGFVRLAINDNSLKGRQPFFWKNLIGVFNGEIYNYKEIINKYKFKLNSESDSELLLPLYEKLGDDFYHSIDGMFTGVIFDYKKKEFIIIKDLTSQKPLFLVRYYNGFSIVSELKSIIKDNVKEIINISSGLTKIDINGEILYRKFYNLKLKADCIRGDNDFYVFLNSLVEDAVNKRIPNDKFGVFLSGGLDSSIIASITKNSDKEVLYYSLISDTGSDLQHIEEVAKFLNIKKENLRLVKVPDFNDIKRIKKLVEMVVYHSESYNPSIISNGIGAFLLSEAAKKDGLKVILSGEGADELFCGYKSFYKNGFVENNWKKLRSEFIENLYFTELRRVDLCCMANSIEARSPFLDKKIIKLTNAFRIEDCFHKKLGKHSLRESFKNQLPKKIVNRAKVSFDIGSGTRNILINYLKMISNEITFSEEDELKKIWDIFFLDVFKKHDKYEYFHSYPSFNHVIKKRKYNF